MSTKVDNVGGIEYKYSSDWIKKLESKLHWAAYHHQQKIMQPYFKNFTNLLEIGVGTRFCSNYIKSQGINIDTIDIDADKKPDIVANVVTYEFEKQYDAVLAFEIFEHIPYEEFTKILHKLSSVSEMVFFSLPRNVSNLLKFDLQILGYKFKFQNWRKKNKITTVNHFWELGYKDYTLSRVMVDIEKANYEILRIEEFKHWNFFVLKKTTL